MDKYEFMIHVEEVLSECKTEQEIEKRVEEMTDVIILQSRLSKGYLNCGILK